jgi:hypothetical protein
VRLLPSRAAAQAAEEAVVSGTARKLPDGISECSQLGFHAYMAGPCFGTVEQAVAYKESLDKEGVKWRPQP